ncbi:HAD family hydrolase [Niallia circulans]|uniref:HAD family hydrolase n=1 Tax=Niallia circulans TaxID=1397 RepID=A0A553SF37_NIACI|nr:HAD family hydrolase [Niallia circulans]TRZ35604.1 HAD family hydrolase [Niallia circulans]
MIKAVLFDLDGTLLNRNEAVLHFAERQYNSIIKATSDISKETYISRFITLDANGYVWKDRVYQQLVEEFHLTGITWQELLQDYVEEFPYSCVPFAHLNEMLAELSEAGLRLGIITNGYGQFQQSNIEALGIKHFFDTILISEWENLRKPEPAIFQRALQRLDATPDESLFIGDHPQNDVEAARNVGMLGVWKENSDWSSAGMEYIVKDLTEIPMLIRKLNQDMDNK